MILYIIIAEIISYVLSLIITKKIYHYIQPLKKRRNVSNIIFRTFNNFTVPIRMYKYCHDDWIYLNPSYSVVWYNNTHCDRFIEKYYNGSVLEAYNKLIPGAFKADLWRLCVLYRYGGVYVDAFACPYESVNSLLENYRKSAKVFISILDAKQSGYGIHNGFIIAEKSHPFLKQAIFDIVDNVKKNYYGNTPLDVTGPIALAKSIQKVVKSKSHIFRAGWNSYGNLGFLLLKLNYGPNQNVYNYDTKVLSKYYSFPYYLYRKTFNKNRYTVLWKNKNIYKMS